LAEQGQGENEREEYFHDIVVPMTSAPSYSSLYKDLLRQTNRNGGWFDFEGLIRDIYVTILKPGDWALDVGAHLGTHTFQMAQAVAPTGKVIAIEAVPQFAQRLGAACVEVHSCGVSDREGTATFYFAPEVAGLSGLRYRSILDSHKVESFEVRLTTIDRICSGASRQIRFIKIDIEGAEYDALRGARQTIERHQPLITFEHAMGTPGDFGYAIEDMMAMWDSLGYSVYDFFGNQYATAQHWADSMVGDYLAFPRTFVDRRRIFKVVHGSLREQGINYSIGS
jgi:FkbM family methyltransferase